jgi:hypothetical protein
MHEVVLYLYLVSKEVDTQMEERPEMLLHLLQFIERLWNLAAALRSALLDMLGQVMEQNLVSFTLMVAPSMVFSSSLTLPGQE